MKTTSTCIPNQETSTRNPKAGSLWCRKTDGTGTVFMLVALERSCWAMVPVFLTDKTELRHSAHSPVYASPEGATHGLVPFFGSVTIVHTES